MKTIGMLLAMLAAGTTTGTRKGRRNFDEQDSKLIKEFRAQKYEKVEEKKGIKEFTIDGYTVKARDYENAVRKVNNLKK